MVLVCLEWFWSVRNGSGVSGVVSECLAWFWSGRPGSGVSAVAAEHQAWFSSGRHSSRASGLVPECQAWFWSIRSGSGASGLVWERLLCLWSIRPGSAVSGVVLPPVALLGASGVNRGLGLVQVPDAQAVQHGVGGPFLEGKPDITPAHCSPLCYSAWSVLGATFSALWLLLS